MQSLTEIVRRHQNYATWAHVEALTVLIEIFTYDCIGWYVAPPVDYSLADAAMSTDIHLRQNDGIPDRRVGVHSNIAEKQRAVHFGT